MSDPKCNLLKNMYHHHGDKLPCLKSHSDSPLEITEPGKYSIAIWPPKEGKKAYFMLLKKHEAKENKEPEVDQTSFTNETPGPVKPIFNDSPFNR